MNSGIAYNQDQHKFEGQPMTNDEIKNFALKLLHVDTEDEVIDVLKMPDIGMTGLHGDYTVTRKETLPR